MIEIPTLKFKQIDIVQKFILDTFHISKDGLFGRTRRKESVEARYSMFYILNKYAKYSSPKIGRIFSMDHSTVLHGIKSVEGTPVEQQLNKLWTEYLKKESERVTHKLSTP